MATALVLLADRGRDGRRLKPVERGLEAIIIIAARSAPDIGQNLVRCRRHQPRGRPPGIARLDELARGPDQYVGVPDGRHAVLGHGLDRDPRLAHAEVDRRGAA